MVCIDVFTKYAVVVALKSKNEGDVASGILECINRMFKKPKLIYTDDEKSFSLPAIQTYFRENKINHYVTRHHAAFGERFIRTFKNMLYKRIDNDIKADVYINPQWIDYIAVSYTHSDAADDPLCVDLGGRRIIKKKKPSSLLILFCYLPLTLLPRSFFFTSHPLSSSALYYLSISC